MKHRIVLAGSLAQKPRAGGHTWVLLQYLLGFKSLDWDVLYLDVINSEMCVTETGLSCAPDHSFNVRYLTKIMEHWGLCGSFALMTDSGQSIAGIPRAEVLARVDGAECLINVMGYLRDEGILSRARRRVFLDIDPGFGQMWHALGLHDPFMGHDSFVTIGENINLSSCGIPTCGLDWITTRPPVVLNYWPMVETDDHAAFTSIATWRGAYAPVDYEGRSYGLRVHEFRKYMALPRVTGRSLELALDIHPAETGDLQLLADNGWVLIDPKVVARDPWTYRAYIQNSKAEFMVAKGMYVQTHSGWLSDRSVCYLASGKPVVAQDTGLRDLYPTGDGLFVFSTLEEAATAIEELERRPMHHRRAARELAQEYFDSDTVLTRLLRNLGLA